MRNEFQLLNGLKNSEAYKALLVLWMGVVTEIEAKRDVAASRGQESAWRYYAGQEKGAKRIITALEERLAQLEEEGGEPAMKPSDVIEKLMAEAKGEMK